MPERLIVDPDVPAYEQLLANLEKQGQTRQLFQLKGCHLEVKKWLLDEINPTQQQRDALAAQVRSIIHPSLEDNNEQLMQIALGVDLLSDVA